MMECVWAWARDVGGVSHLPAFVKAAGVKSWLVSDFFISYPFFLPALSGPRVCNAAGLTAAVSYFPVSAWPRTCISRLAQPKIEIA